MKNQESKSIPKFEGHSPCVDMWYGLHIPKLVLSPRRWTIDGKMESPDGAFLSDRSDIVLTRPIDPIQMAVSARKALTMSKQFGKKIPPLPPSFRDMFEISDTDHLFRIFQPIIIWTHRDETTPYVLGSTITDMVNVDLETVSKTLSDSELGVEILRFMKKVGRLAGASLE